MNLKDRFAKKNDNLRIAHTDPFLCRKMSEKIISWLPSTPREYVVLCIGTDRSTGDSLGPLTGAYFSEMKPKYLTVYGTLQDPVHAKNLHNYIHRIHEQHTNPYVIAIDACLGKSTSVGCISAGIGSLKPGAALNKPLPAIGDIHITGIVNISGFMDYAILQNTRLAIVVDMARKIAMILEMIDQQLTHSRSFPAIVLPQVNEITAD